MNKFRNKNQENTEEIENKRKQWSKVVISPNRLFLKENILLIFLLKLWSTYITHNCAEDILYVFSLELDCEICYIP